MALKETTQTAPKIIFKAGEPEKFASAVASVNTEVKMIPASPTATVPPYYPMMDGKVGGVPNPKTSGPSMIQIGTEGGFLPYPVVLPNTPIGYTYNRRDITVLNVDQKTLFMGPAERADVIIDFSEVPKNVSTVILYNDSPAPVPGFDPRIDYYINDSDFTSTGGAPSTLAGYGPNTRTIMQFRLHGKKKKAFNLAALETALPQAYVASQDAPVIPETTYPEPYRAASNTYSQIQDTSLTFTPVGQTTPINQAMMPKSIIEGFDLSYGRMNAQLGNEMLFTNDGNQTSVPLMYMDPPTEFIADGQTQIWKITHNGVDTHAIHTHLFNMQLINRVGWDGMVKPPDANELGWKETIRMNPLEDAIIAFRPKQPTLPESILPIPNSVRLWDPTMMEGATWSSFDPYTGAGITWTNSYQNYGWEYVWHCHLLGHEENDMMRPISFNLVTTTPSATYTPGAGSISFHISPPPSTNPTSYQITIIGPTGRIENWVSTTPTITGLSPGSVYTFRIVAVYGQVPIPIDPISPHIKPPAGISTSMPLVITNVTIP